MALENLKKADRCQPNEPAPQQTEQEVCEGTLTGSITGTVRMEGCCCQRLMTRTFWTALGPQTIEQVDNFVQNTVNAYESQGYLVMAHSVMDSGDGWRLGLTVGWYTP